MWGGAKGRAGNPGQQCEGRIFGMVYLFMAKLKYVDAKAQLVLSFCRDGETLKWRLEKGLGRAVSLVITDNAASMVSAKMLRDSVAIRLHKMFLDADDAVVSEIVDFVKKGGGKTALIRKYIRDNSADIRRKAPNRGRIRTGGTFHDLMEIFNVLNNAYFEKRVQSSITWATKVQKRAVRKRTLGSYSNHTDVIRISPALDRKGVPRYFIEFVVYHEMLHADLRGAHCDGRRVVHSKEFRRRERQFKDYERAIAWEQRLSV